MPSDNVQIKGNSTSGSAGGGDANTIPVSGGPVAKTSRNTIFGVQNGVVVP